MHNLLKVELYKLKKFPLGYIAMLFMFVCGYLYGDNRLAQDAFEVTDNTSAIFSYTVCDTSMVFIISIVSALFLGKDFSNHTICNEIKLGYHRFHVLLSRAVVVCAFSGLLHMIYIAATILGFSVVRGFDASLLCIRNALWLLTVLIQLTAIISGVVFVSFLVKRVSEAIAISTLYVFICCNILRNFTDTRFFTLSCFCFVRSSSENFVFVAANAFLTMIIFLAIAMCTFKKAEIK